MHNSIHYLNPISDIEKTPSNEYRIKFQVEKFELDKLTYEINTNLRGNNYLLFTDLTRFNHTRSFIFDSEESAIDYIKNRDNSMLGDYFMINNIYVTTMLSSMSMYTDFYIDVQISDMSYNYMNHKRKIIPAIVSLDNLYLIFIIEDVIINRQNKIMQIRKKISKFDANVI